MSNTIGAARNPVNPLGSNRAPSPAPRASRPAANPVGHSSISSFEPAPAQSRAPAPPVNQSCGGPTDPSAGYDGKNLSRSDLFALTDQAARDEDLPPEVMRAIALQESGGIQWTSNGNVVENDDGNGTTDWGVMQLNTDGWLGSELDVSRAKSDERYNIQMSAKELRTASDYWFSQKYGHPFTMQWYDSLSPAGQKEARIDLFRSYNGWLPDPSNAYPYEQKIDSGAIGQVSSGGTSSNGASSEVPSVNLKYGQDDDQVKQLQTDLVKLGYMTQAQMDTGPGTYGPRTKAAVAQLQHDAGYASADGGGYGPKTRAALTKALKASANAPSAGLKYGQTSDQVKQLQTQLVKLGYMTQAQMDTGPGIYGPRTTAAVAQLEQDAGYSGDGKSYDAQGQAALQHALAVHSLTGSAPKPQAPQAGGAITSVSQANAFFTNQWAGYSKYNTETSELYGYSDCGPTSTLMIASSLGLIAPPKPGTAEDQIDHMRDLALGYDTTQSQGTDESQMANAISQLGGTSQYLDQSISEVDAALAKGERVLIAGDPWNAWGAQMDANGQYLNHRDPGAHFVAILGKTSDGQYIVADPLSGVGAITVSAQQIQSFWQEGGGESGAMAVGR